MKPAALFVLALQAVGLHAQGCSFGAVEGSRLKTQRTDVSWGKGKTCRTKDGSSKAKEMCAFTLKCQKSKDLLFGYFFPGDYDGEGIRIKCMKGKWKTDDGNEDVPACVTGCLRLDKNMMKNATFKGREPKEIYRTDDGLEMYPVGTVVETECKPGFVFTNEVLDKNGFDRHRCINEPVAGWRDEINKIDRSWPAVCHAVCPKLTYTLDEGVEVLYDAENNPANLAKDESGNVVLRPKSMYTFKCKDGYKPANPIHTNGQQQLVCNGGWQDNADPHGVGKPLKCNAQGCPAIKTDNLPKNAILETGEGCGSGAAKLDNCEVTIKCAKTDGRLSGLGYFMPNKPAGYKLKCVKGNWVQEDNKPASPDSNGIYGGSCKPGCAGLSTSDRSSTDVIKPADGVANKNDDIDFYEPGVMFTTGCKSDYVRPGLDNQPKNGEVFQCKSDGWKSMDGKQEQLNIYPNTCVAACEVPADTVGGTNYRKGGAITMKNERQMMQRGSTITSSCKDKFKPPSGMSSTQSLTCEGGQHGWKNTQSEKTNENVLVCVRDGAAGCTPVVPGSGTVVVQTGNCDLVEGLLPAGCKLSVKCKPGFVPDGPATVSPDGEQSLTCKAGNDGYEDNNSGAKNTTGLKCIPGCEMFELMEAAVYVIPPKQSDILTTYAGKKYLRPSTEVNVKCKPIEQGYYYNNNGDKQRAENGKPNVMYICKGGDEKYLKTTSDSKNKMPGDCCGPVCDSLDTQEHNSTNVVKNMRIENSIEFVTNHIRRVVGVQFESTCQMGYEFPKGSKELTEGKQHLLCVGGSKGYVDLSNNATNSKLTICVKSEAPRCPPIDSSITNVELSGLEGACNPSTGKFNEGCKLTVKCAEGTFPIDGYTGTSNTQEIKCNIWSNNTAVWTEINFGEGVEPMQCSKGCAHVKPTNAFSIIQFPSSDATVTSGGVSYYKRNAEMTVRCNEGFIPRIESGIKPDQGKLGMPFRCLAYEADAPWKNVLSDYVDMGPAHICVKTCPALKAEKEGVSIKNGPTEELTTTGSIVSGGGEYTFSCKPNYVYENPAHAANNEQRLYCDPATGKYVDKTTGSNTPASVAECRKKDEGCRDLPVSQGHITSDCKSGWKDGCSISVQCNEGFIPSDSKYHQSGTQKLKCKGFQWVDENGNGVQQAMQCKEACKFDPSTISSNSKVNDVSTTTITVDDQVYVVAGTSIKVTCQGDGVIWVNNAKETTNQHEYKCSGGKTGFTREEDNKINVIVGEGCVGTCISMFTTSPDASLVLKEKPQTITHNGQNLVPEGLGYVFTCADNYVYPIELLLASETYKCNGKTRKFENPATSVPLNKPTKCVRNPKLDECAKLHVDEEAVEQQTGGGCSFAGHDLFKSGCVFSFKCKEGFKPTDANYWTPEGLQVLTCNTGGIGWKDREGRVISDALQCVPGCVTSKNLTWQGVEIWLYIANVNQENVEARCFNPLKYNNGTDIDNSNNRYACPVDTTKYYNDFCPGACRELRASAIPQGVVQKDAAAKLDARLDYVYAKSSYIFACSDGWAYPENSPYASSGRQILTCENETNQYYDEITGTATNEIAPCVENKRCKTLPLSLGATMENLNNCDGTQGESKDKCTITYKCFNGFYPADNVFLYEGVQKMTCDGKQKSWVDKNNKPVTQVLQCLPGCSSLDYVTIVNYLNKTDVSVGMQMFRDDKGGENMCYSQTTVNEINKIVQQVQRNKSPYFCKTKDPVTETETIKDTKNACQGTCVAIPNMYPEGVSRVETPATFTGPNNVDYATTKDAYVFKCLAGYEYQPGTPEATKKEQRLRCLGNGSYVDANTGVVTNQIKPCQKIRGCEKIKSTATTKYDYGVNCGSNNDLVPNGCQVTVACQTESYPTQPKHRLLDGAKYACQVNNLGQSVWIETKTSKQPPFKFECSTGCLPVSDIIRDKREDTTTIKVGTLSCTKASTSFNISNMGDTVKHYYCELRKGTNNEIILLPLTCTGGCVMAPPPAGITVEHSEKGKGITKYYNMGAETFKFPLGEAELTTESMAVLCPAGKKFQDTNTARRVFTCRDNGQFYENDQVVATINKCI